jgi:hypothetical protein
MAVFGHTEYFTARLVPPIVASFVSGGLDMQKSGVLTSDRALLQFSATELSMYHWHNHAHSSSVTSSAG